LEFFEFTDMADTFFTLFGGDVHKQYMWAYFLIGAVCFATVYAFQAIALYTIAAREGYDKKWMAFVPFFNTYYIGVVAEKNKIFNFKPKQVAIFAAALEFIYCALSTVYLVAQFAIFDGGYAVPEYEMGTWAGIEGSIFTGAYTISELPHGLSWAGWVFAYFPNAFLSWLSLLNLIVDIFLLIAFFQTYSCRHYVLFAFVSVLFPLKGIFMFAVRNNKGKNYGQYLRERQQMQYQAYQEYMRRNGGYNNYGNQGGPSPYNGGSYYGGNSTPKDPFDGMGGGNNEQGGGGQSSSGKKDDDPFGDF